MNQVILAVDPGTTHSAIVALRGKEIIQHGKYPNAEAIEILRSWGSVNEPPTMVIENISGQRRGPGGKVAPVGQETFETCVWIGRFIERYGERRTHRIERSEVVRHVCGKIPRAKEGEPKVSRDTLVRRGVHELYTSKSGVDPIGKKAAPGPLYGIASDQWSALAIGITFRDTVKKKR